MTSVLASVAELKLRTFSAFSEVKIGHQGAFIQRLLVKAHYSFEIWDIKGKTQSAGFFVKGCT